MMANLRTTVANVQSRQCDQGDQDRNDEWIKECFGISLFQRHVEIMGHNKSDVLHRATLMDLDDGNVEVEEAALLEAHGKADITQVSNSSSQIVADWTRLYKNERLTIDDPNTAWRWSGWISIPFQEFCRVQLNPDQNLVVYHAKNNVFTPLWETGPSQGGSHCWLAPQTCSLECFDIGRHWHYGRVITDALPLFHSTRVGQCANPILVMQTDCNLVLYSGEGLPAVWSTQTNGFVNRIVSGKPIR